MTLAVSSIPRLPKHGPGRESQADEALNCKAEGICNKEGTGATWRYVHFPGYFSIPVPFLFLRWLHHGRFDKRRHARNDSLLIRFLPRRLTYTTAVIGCDCRLHVSTIPIKSSVEEPRTSLPPSSASATDRALHRLVRTAIPGSRDPFLIKHR